MSDTTVSAEQVERVIERIAKLSRAKQEFLLGFIAHMEKEQESKRRIKVAGGVR